MIGRKFGRLTVLDFADRKEWKQGRGAYYLCQCECGNVINANGVLLRNGGTRSCGCLTRERNGESRTGGKEERLYRIWNNMKSRCGNPNATGYNLYGGRGITVCEEWRTSFAAFRDWALANGYRDDLSIDRIDADGNYEPSNCRWATAKQQTDNKYGQHGQLCMFRER